MFGFTYVVAQMVKKLPAMQGTQVRSLGQEDPLEKEMAIHCSILAWKIPCREEPRRLQSMGSQRVRHDWATNTFTPIFMLKKKRIHSFHKFIMKYLQIEMMFEIYSKIIQHGEGKEMGQRGGWSRLTICWLMAAETGGWVLASS